MDNSNDNERTIPIACRYVPYDQWLMTRLHPSWRIDQIKLFILSKCLGTAYMPESKSSRRSPSPITFAPLPMAIERPPSPIMFAPPARSRPRSSTLDGDRHVNLAKVRVMRAAATASPSNPDDSCGELEEEINRGYEEDDEYDTAEDEAASFAPRTYRPQRQNIATVSPEATSLPSPNYPLSATEPSFRPNTTSTTSTSATAVSATHISSSSLPRSISMTPALTSPSSSSPPSPAAYTLIRFSTGQLLEDRLNLSNYEVAPYELLELHGEHSKSPTKPVFPPHSQRDSASLPSIEHGLPVARRPKPSKLIRHIVSLDRSNVQTYVTPYWEGWVKALRVVNRDDLDVAMGFGTNQRKSARRPGHRTSESHGKDPIFGGVNWGFGGVGGIGGMGAGFGVIVDDEILKLRDEDVAGMFSDSGREGEAARRKKSGKTGREPKIKLEWKERWVVVQGDMLYICKDREDVNPAQRISLSSLVTIRDKEFLLRYPSTATSPFVSSSPQVGEFGYEFPESPLATNRRRDKVNDHSKYVICARFRSKSGRVTVVDNNEGRASPVGFSRLSHSTVRNRSSSVNTPEQVGSPTTSQYRVQTQRPGGIEQHQPSDPGYYRQMALVAAAGIFPYIPSLPVVPSPTESTGAEKDAKSMLRRTVVVDSLPQRPSVTSGDENTFEQPSTHLNTAASPRDEGIKVDVGFPPGRSRAVSSPSPTTTSHAINIDSYERPMATSPAPSFPSTAPTCNEVSSPVFAHSSESEWEKDIFGINDRNKQPYQYGYQPAYRWKDSREYGIARDVWQEELEKASDDSGKAIRKGKDRHHNDKQKGKEKDKEGREKDPRAANTRSHQYEWIILDMGGSPAFNSILRVLHRTTPTVASSFRSNYMRKISAGAGDNRSPLSRHNSGGSSLSKRNRSRLRTTFGASSDADDLHSDHDLPSTLTASPSRPDLSSWSERLGVLPYPEWRIKVTRRAQMAALGNVGNATLYYMFGTLDFGEQDKVPRGRRANEAGKEGLPVLPKGKSGKARKRTQSHASTATATSVRKRGSGSEDTEHTPFELESSDESNNETEWHGWMLDVTRQAQSHAQRETDGALATEIDVLGSEITRRAALEPKGSVTSISTQFLEISIPTSESTVVADRSSALGSFPSHLHTSISGSPRQQSSSRPTEQDILRATSSPLAASPSFELVSVPHGKPPSSHSPQSQPRHLLHHSNSMYGGLRSETSPLQRSRRQPSMPHLSLEHNFSSAKSSVASDCDARKPSATRLDPQLGGPVHGDCVPDAPSSEIPSFSTRRRSAALGLAGSLGRSASLFGGLWRKEPKEAKDARDGIYGERGKVDKGKRKANVTEAEGQKQEPEYPRATSPLIRGSTSIALLRRATSGSSLGSLEGESRLSQTGVEAERKRLKKKGRLTHEVDKIARGFDDETYA